MDAARSAESKKKAIEPFTTQALEGAILATSRVPGKFLTLLHIAIEKAIQENWREIGAKQMQMVIDARAHLEDKKDGPEILPPSSISLQRDE